MNRIDQRFATLKEKGKAAFIPYLTIGDPNVEVTEKLIHELVRQGADLIELGVPYSDPLADGPVIQRAAQRALQHEINIQVVLDLANRCRADGIQIPFILFTYYNPILQFGIDAAMEQMVRNGIDGMIIPDLPIEESDVVRVAAAAKGLHLIPLVAPTSNERIAKICKDASGFIYCVSSLGVTGTRSEFFAGIDGFLEQVKRSTNLPVCVGFGISTPDQFRYFADRSDGVIVGSAIVRTVEEALEQLQSDTEQGKGIAHFQTFIKQLVNA